MVKPVPARAGFRIRFHRCSHVYPSFIRHALAQAAPTSLSSAMQLLKHSRYHGQLQKISIDVWWNYNKLVPKDG